MKKKLPENWVETEFKELASFVIGGDWGKDLKFEFDVDSEIVSCIRGSEIKNWERDKGSTASLRKIKTSSLEKRALVEGDILLEISGGGPDQPVGRTVYIDEETLNINSDYKKVCTNFLRMVRLYDNLNKKFIKHYLDSFYLSGEILKYQGGSNNLRNLKYKEFETIVIPLPPLAEQQRIVAKLDKLFEHVDSLKTRLNHIPQILKNFRQAVLTQAVTGKLTEEWRIGKELEEWRKDTLGNLIDGTPKNGAYYHKSLYGSGTRIIRIDSFYDGALKSWDIVQYVEIPESDKEIYGLTLNDILINRVNSIEYLGKCMLVDSLPEDCIYESNMMRIKCNTEIISPEYLKTYLISPNGLKELRKNAKYSVNQASINQQDVKGVVVNYPSIKEQTEIVKRVEHLFAKADTIEAQYQSLKTRIDSLPQAILAKAFKGELVEQLETDGNAIDLLKEIKELKAAAVPKKKVTTQIKTKSKIKVDKARTKGKIKMPVKGTVKAETIKPIGIEANFIWLHLKAKFGSEKFTIDQVDLPPKYSYDRLKEEIFDLLDECRKLEKGPRLVQSYKDDHISYQIKLK